MKGEAASTDFALFLKLDAYFPWRPSKVFIFNTLAYQHDQEKMCKLYMNRFAIEEDEQFEIHVKDVPGLTK